MALAVYMFKQDLASLYNRLLSVDIPPLELQGGLVVSVSYKDPLDEKQIEELNQAMLDAGFLPDKQVFLKDARALELQVTARTYIYAHYEPERQQTLAILLSEARFAGLVNRANYIVQALGWVDSIFTYYYTKKAEIEAATKDAEIAAVTWDFAQFDDTDPVVSIKEARSIPD